MKAPAGPYNGALDLPTDALIFKFPPSLVWLMLGSSIVALVLMALILFLPLTDPRHGSPVVALVGVAKFGSMAALCLRSFRRFRDSVAANSAGIWYLPRKGQSTYIAWCEIASVIANDTQQRMVLSDQAGTRSIRLEYQLTDFGRLREFVIGHTPSTTRTPVTTANAFHRTWINKGILLGGTAVLLLCAFASGRQGQLMPSLFLIGFAAFSVISITLDPTSVVIMKEGIAIKYPGWQRNIPFSAITRIAVTDVYSRGNVWAAVVVERRQGRPIKLFRFREGSIALDDALRSAWQAAGADPESVRPT